MGWRVSGSHCRAGPGSQLWGRSQFSSAYYDQRPPSGGTSGLQEVSNAEGWLMPDPCLTGDQALASLFPDPMKPVAFWKQERISATWACLARNPSVVQVGHAGLRGPPRHSAGRGHAQGGGELAAL